MHEVLLTGKTVMVTGASRGIGRALAVGFASRGASVAIVGRSSEGLSSTFEQITKAGGSSHAVVADVDDLASIESACAETVEKFGHLDAVVANAGIDYSPQEVETSLPDQWRATVLTNVVGVYHTIRSTTAYLRESGGGSIVAIGSGGGRIPVAGRSAYACSKAALGMLVKITALELRDDGIIVNELIPGPVQTGMLQNTLGIDSSFGEHNLSGEWFKDAADVVPLAAFLVAQPAHGPTGQTFSLMRRPW